MDKAIADYLDGNLQAARLELIRLSSDPRLADVPALRQRVDTYLGEVLYVMGDREASWENFVAVVLDDPDFRLDPFVHPPDVVTFFESAREYAQRLLPSPDLPAPLPPPPGLLGSLLPGRLQFYNDQPVLGYLSIGAVTLSGAAAFGLGLYVRTQDANPDAPGVNLRPSRADDLRTLLLLQDVHNVATGAAAGVWSLAVIQGALRASRGSAQVGDVSLRMVPIPAGPGAAASLQVAW